MFYNSATGRIEKTKVFLVCGSPASGKTTYVNNHKSPGDFVFDIDLIRQALGATHKTADCFQPLILEIRRLVYNSLRLQAIGAKNAWVISGLPTKAERERTAKEIGAEIIFLHAKRRIASNVQ